MKFPVRFPGMKHAKQAGKVFFVYEGEQLTEAEAKRADYTKFTLVRAWRPDGEPVPDGIEPIPGYQRPVNWKELQDAEDKAKGAAELVGEDGKVLKRWEGDH